MEQTDGDCPALSQAAVTTWLPSNTQGTSRFHGDGVRYKAKLIGLDAVPEAQGEKMCYDSMMKLKGFEEAARRQGRHKKRVWLKICSRSLKIVDERTGAVLHDQDKSRLSSLTKDETDLRALAYIYHHEDRYILFYIRMANLADPVFLDIKEMCQSENEEAPQKPSETPAQSISLLPLNLSSASTEECTSPEGVFSPRPDTSAGQSNPTSHNELMAVFSIPLEDPLTPSQAFGASPPDSLHWGQMMGPYGNQWAGPAQAPWPNMPSNMPVWGTPGGPSEYVMGSQPGFGGVAVGSTASGSFPNPNPPGSVQNSNQNFDPLL
ncbi:disabled homolog 1-like isoform X2 [Gouania willdenowi]|uniref:disabled homolog 1-like isoform X2 n=1 Tax=Gouania willdenowi TaxID=441366 RepID=UPI0010545FCC|nr:disabled homolog 1-like isoform X2 [Gouania willdenowi]